MKFVAKERKTIDAVRWTGDNVSEVFEWGEKLGLVVTSMNPDSTAALRIEPNPERTNEPKSKWRCIALTLHGDVEIESGSWAAYGGTDVYPLDDGELHRLYDRLVPPGGSVVKSADLTPGTVLEHENGARAVLRERKTGDDAVPFSGWWVEGGGGLADFVLDGALRDGASVWRVVSVPPTDALLGLATTRQLLEELRARFGGLTNEETRHAWWVQRALVTLDAEKLDRRGADA